jgi:hypothetical protein
LLGVCHESTDKGDKTDEEETIDSVHGASNQLNT